MTKVDRLVTGEALSAPATLCCLGRVENKYFQILETKCKFYLILKSRHVSIWTNGFQLCTFQVLIIKKLI